MNVKKKRKSQPLSAILMSLGLDSSAEDDWILPGYNNKSNCNQQQRSSMWKIDQFSRKAVFSLYLCANSDITGIWYQVVVTLRYWLKKIKGLEIHEKTNCISTHIRILIEPKKTKQPNFPFCYACFCSFCHYGSHMSCDTQKSLFIFRVWHIFLSWNLFYPFD